MIFLLLLISSIIFFSSVGNRRQKPRQAEEVEGLNTNTVLLSVCGSRINQRRRLSLWSPEEELGSHSLLFSRVDLCRSCCLCSGWCWPFQNPDLSPNQISHLQDTAVGFTALAGDFVVHDPKSFWKTRSGAALCSSKMGESPLKAAAFCPKCEEG